MMNILRRRRINKLRNDEENVNNEIFEENFGYQTPSFLPKNLLKANKMKNNQIVYQAIYSINEIRNPVLRKEILKMKIQIKCLILLKKSFFNYFNWCFICTEIYYNTPLLLSTELFNKLIASFLLRKQK